MIIQFTILTRDGIIVNNIVQREDDNAKVLLSGKFLLSIHTSEREREREREQSEASGKGQRMETK